MDKRQKQLLSIIFIIIFGSFLIGDSYGATGHYNIIRALAGQVSDLLNIQDSNGVDLIKVTSAGNMVFKSSDNITSVHDINTTRLFVNSQAVDAPQIFDMNASRAFNATYQNLSGNTIFLSISYTESTLSNNDGVKVNLHIQNITPPTQDITIRLLKQKGGQALTQDDSVFGIIPQGYYYQVLQTKNGTGSASIATWIEYR